MAGWITFKKLVHESEHLVQCLNNIPCFVYHLPKNSGNFGWDVNGKTVLVCPNGNFPK